MELNFNVQTKKPRFIYKHNPLIKRSYQIFELMPLKDDYEPVGDYTVLAMDEDLELSEKKMMNVVSLLNGKKDLIDLSGMVKSPLLFSMVPRTEKRAPTKIIFRTYDGTGVSVENALLTLERGILNEHSTKH